MDINAYIKQHGASDFFVKLYTGEVFNFTPQQNKEDLLINIEAARNDENNNNLKIISNELNKHGGHQISFANSCADAILICAVSSQDDYYYVYYDIMSNAVRATTCCDGIEHDFTECEIASPIALDCKAIDQMIDDYISKHEYYEVPFTKVYKSADWTFHYMNINKIE